MRSEQEMMELVLGFARQDSRVRAAGLNGSRANPAAPRDCMQDYDIALLVTELESFTRDHSWVDRFGKRAIMQMPEAMVLFPPELGGWFTYLMQFEDGNRLDLMLIPAVDAQKYLQKDPMTVVLLDKDGLLAGAPPPSDAAFYVKRPSAEEYADCCNEFWWVCTYVAKGLWRGELLYANWHMEQVVRPMLQKMLEWQVGAGAGFTLSVGKCGKYLHKHLPAEVWQALLATYRCDSTEACWGSLWGCVVLFRKTAQQMAAQLDFEYDIANDDGACKFMHRVQDAGSDCPW